MKICEIAGRLVYSEHYSITKAGLFVVLPKYVMNAGMLLIYSVSALQAVPLCYPAEHYFPTLLYVSGRSQKLVDYHPILINGRKERA